MHIRTHNEVRISEVLLYLAIVGANQLTQETAIKPQKTLHHFLGGVFLSKLAYAGTFTQKRGWV